jgi:hypothetical protein
VLISSLADARSSSATRIWNGPHGLPDKSTASDAVLVLRG